MNTNAEREEKRATHCSIFRFNAINIGLVLQAPSIPEPDPITISNLFGICFPPKITNPFRQFQKCNIETA